jgi:hypothetical protein
MDMCGRDTADDTKPLAHAAELQSHVISDSNLRVDRISNVYLVVLDGIFGNRRPGAD